MGTHAIQANCSQLHEAVNELPGTSNTYTAAGYCRLGDGKRLVVGTDVPPLAAAQDHLLFESVGERLNLGLADQIPGSIWASNH